MVFKVFPYATSLLHREGLFIIIDYIIFCKMNITGGGRVEEDDS